MTTETPTTPDAGVDLEAALEVAAWHEHTVSFAQEQIESLDIAAAASGADYAPTTDMWREQIIFHEKCADAVAILISELKSARSLIAEQAALLEEGKRAVGPFVEHWASKGEYDSGEIGSDVRLYAQITYGHFRAARAWSEKVGNNG